MKKPVTHSIVRRREIRPTGGAIEVNSGISHTQAFQQAYGAHTHQIKPGSLRSRDSDEAMERAAACMAACEGLSLHGLKDGALAILIEAARSAVRVLDGRLVRVDPEATLVRDRLKKSMRRLGL